MTIASSTWTPLALSSEPVGSSQNSTAGPLGDGAGHRHALLLAAGKLGREVIEPVGEADQPSASSGFMGLSAISVISSTFSRAVRLGVRLKNWKMKPTERRR